VSESDSGRRQMTAVHVIAVAIGGLLSAIALPLIVLGALLGFLYAVERDDDGFLTSPRERLVTATSALTAEDIDLGTDIGPDNPIWDLDLGTVRISSVSVSGDAPIFIGIGPEEEVDRYLSGVAHEEIEDIDLDPFRYETTFRRGAREPGPPAEQTFWEASSAGVGEQSIEWEVERGRWALVLMNADGSPGVTHLVKAGVKTDLLLSASLVLAGVGALLLILGVGLVIFGVRGLSTHPRHAPPPPPPGALRPVYPARLTGSLDDDLSQGLWLVKWLLAIPHFLVLIVLWIAFWFVTLIAFFAIIFTERYPRGLFDFNVGVMRWTWRVAFYATSALGTDRYPPFTLESVDDYPADFQVEYPDRLSRGLVLVKWWLLAIPHFLILAAIGGGLQWPALGAVDELPAWAGPANLVTILVIIAGVSLLFTGRYPRGIFEFVMGLNRWAFRVYTYVALMTDRYPPFRLDMGEGEPPPEKATQEGAS
jgi:hypothetical protein